MNKLFIITGPSGSGKTTLMDALKVKKIITMTTREKRLGEENEVDYFFTSKETFEELIEKGEIIEYNLYSNDHYYGITKEKLRHQIEKGDVYIIVEENGVHKYKEFFPDSISIYIDVEFKDIEKQLLDRGGNSDDIKNRLQTYEVETKHKNICDFVIKNEYGFFNETLIKLENIINKKNTF